MLLMVGSAFSIYLSSHLSLGAAARWGEFVKGCFDVFLPDLRQKLGLKPPRNREEEREMWRAMSTVFVTREPDGLPEFHGAKPAKQVVRKRPADSLVRHAVRRGGSAARTALKVVPERETSAENPA
jgi:hypothetical protein